MPIAAGNPGPLLGRNVEIDLLASLLGGIDTGGSALVLSGEPGIGKSRLLSAAAERARERGLVVLSTTGCSLRLICRSRAFISCFARCVPRRRACLPRSAPCSTPPLCRSQQQQAP